MRSSTFGIASVIARSNSSCGDFETRGRRPMSNVMSVTPTAQMSDRASTSFQRARACSGDMKAGVPIIKPFCVVGTLSLP